MDLTRFDSLEPAEIRRYLEFLLWHYRVVDGFWFIYNEERWGRPEAERLNEKVWRRVSGMAARDLMSRFNITEGGLGAFVRVLRLYPWAILLEYEIEEAPGEVVVTVPVCASQEARRRRQLPEYECREMHRAEFTELAQIVDPRIEVSCEFAPPAQRPEHVDCRWHFTLGDEHE